MTRSVGMLCPSKRRARVSDLSTSTLTSLRLPTVRLASSSRLGLTMRQNSQHHCPEIRENGKRRGRSDLLESSSHLGDPRRRPSTFAALGPLSRRCLLESLPSECQARQQRHSVISDDASMSRQDWPSCRPRNRMIIESVGGYEERSGLAWFRPPCEYASPV
jgi:hypothetical protein